MAENSHIEWTHHTFNPWTGCSKVHAGCKYCYAEHEEDTRFHRVKWGSNGTRRQTSEANRRKPIIWNRKAMLAGERHRVFCASLADVFEDREDLAQWRRELFDLIDQTNHLDWLLLTKRPENIRDMWPDDMPRHNVWLGTSISDQATADEWTQRLVQVEDLAPILFISAEPLIGRVVLPNLEQIDWVIVGGESHRPPLRPCQDQWVRDLILQCGAARVPVFVKQLGSREDLRHAKGGDMSEWAEDLRVREFPEAHRRTSRLTGRPIPAR